MIELKQYRGYIRNWKALCNELRIDPACPREERERRIIVSGYERWGRDIGRHLHGMFAMALWNSATQELICIRDQLGIKTFYYYLTGENELLHGNDIPEILGQRGFVKTLNHRTLQSYLTFSYAPGEETFFAGLKKLMPGHYLTWRSGRLQVVRYWKPDFQPDFQRTTEQWSDAIHSTLRQILLDEETPEETVETFLSSGVDSSYLLAMSKAVRANSVGFDDAPCDESALAEDTSRRLDVPFHRTRISPQEYFEAIPCVMHHLAQPLGDASAVAFALGCRAASANTKICYSGEGADEFFGGYYGYESADQLAGDPDNLYLGCTVLMSEDEKRSLLIGYDPAVRPAAFVEEIYEQTASSERLSRMLAVDLQLWLEGDIYLNADKMSTAFGLELRLPLSDLRMFELARRIPARSKVDETHYKYAFRLAATKVLPPEIAFRKKAGFPVPIRGWLADARYNGSVREMLHGPIATKFFNAFALEGLWKRFIDGETEVWRPLYAIHAFLVWYRLFFPEDE
jgi:asparagine synthase (glutamine-hydrolysing)